MEEKVLQRIKENAITIWKTYDDQFGYATEKITRVNEANEWIELDLHSFFNILIRYIYWHLVIKYSDVKIKLK